MLAAKRPGNGLPITMMDSVIGKRASRDIRCDQIITLDMLKKPARKKNGDNDNSTI